MFISFDYDGTWTTAPTMWATIVKTMKAKGHKCICITSRSRDTKDGKLKNSIGKYMKIIYAAGTAKTEVAKKNGYSIDVWIDDNPRTITSNFSSTISGTIADMFADTF